MAYLIFAIDFDGMDEKREDLREAHRRHLKSVGSKLLASGALLDDDEEIIGGISLLDIDDKEEAEQFATDDPYSVANLRKETKVIRWRRRWVDGKFIGNVS